MSDSKNLSAHGVFTRRAFLGYAGVGAAMAGLPAFTDAAIVVIRSKRGYVDGPYGQIHYRLTENRTATDQLKRPLAFFHQNPRSSYEYVELMAKLARDRLCVAFDTPGYGQSAPPPEPPGIAGYSAAMVQALDALGYGADGKGAVDAFGFHTGTFVAAEVAARRPDLINRLVLAGVPYTTGEEQQDFYDRLVVNRSPRPASGSHMVDRWHSYVANRPEGLDEESGRKLMLASMVSGDRSWWAYKGVFTYPTAERFAKIKQPVLLLAVNDLLRQHTIASESLLSDATLIDMPDVEGAFVLMTHAEELAAPTRAFLDLTS